MENASKALLMAGGILIALMILSLIVYLSTSMTRIANTQDEIKETKQIREFNKSYEAYNKSLMYGTDVITVVNKAIDYNQRVEADDKEYYININIKTAEDFITTKQTTEYKANGEIDKEYADSTVQNKTLIEGEYDLLEGNKNFNEKFLNFFDQDSATSVTSEKEQLPTGNWIVTDTYSALYNFKKSTFKCTKVEYSEITGRIKSMSFEQRKR